MTDVDIYSVKIEKWVSGSNSYITLLKSCSTTQLTIITLHLLTYMSQGASL